MRTNLRVELGSEFDGIGGIPTFQEFCKNPERWLGHPEDKLAEVERGGSSINQVTQKHIYEIEGYRCKTLEEVQRVAESQGIPVEALDYRPEVIPNVGHKCDVKIVFVPKWRREQRSEW